MDLAPQHNGPVHRATLEAPDALVADVRNRRRRRQGRHGDDPGQFVVKDAWVSAAETP